MAKLNLVKKHITDKNGKRTTVWVRIDENKSKPKKNVREEVKDSNNPIYSEAFKKWFGDWEKKEGSKVVKKGGKPAENYHMSKAVDSKGKPVKIYHGTASGGFSEFETKNIGEYNLWGKGFYFTEDKDIAQEYTHKDEEDIAGEAVSMDHFDKKTGKIGYISHIPKETVDSMLSNKDYTNPNWDDKINYLLEQMNGSDGVHIVSFLDKYKDDNTKYLNKWNGKVEEGAKSRMTVKLGLKSFFNRKEVKEAGLIPVSPPSELYEVYLNIQNPFDMTKVATAEDIAKIVGSIKTDLYWKDLRDEYRDPTLGGNIEDMLYDGNLEDTDMNLTLLQEMKQKLGMKRWQGDNQWQGKIIHRKGERVYPILKGGKGAITIEEVMWLLSDGSRYGKIAKEYADKQGHDGIVHEGGWNLSGGKGTPETHKVWIAFEPNQIKSTKAKEFSTESNDIYKAK